MKPLLSRHQEARKWFESPSLPPSSPLLSSPLRDLEFERQFCAIHCSKDVALRLTLRRRMDGWMDTEQQKAGGTRHNGTKGKNLVGSAVAEAWYADSAAAASAAGKI